MQFPFPTDIGMKRRPELKFENICLLESVHHLLIYKESENVNSECPLTPRLFQRRKQESPGCQATCLSCQSVLNVNHQSHFNINQSLCTLHKVADLSYLHNFFLSCQRKFYTIICGSHVLAVLENKTYLWDKFVLQKDSL